MRADSWLEPPPNYAVTYLIATVSCVLHGGPRSPNQFDIAKALRNLLTYHYGELVERNFPALSQQWDFTVFTTRVANLCGSSLTSRKYDLTVHISYKSTISYV
jgi:hypothetical protein